MRNYTIIDHIGSLDTGVLVKAETEEKAEEIKDKLNEKLMKKVYKLANQMSVNKAKETYTLKGFCKKISDNPFIPITDEQKNYVRFNKHPDQVILICTNIKDKKTRWYYDNWAEKCNNVTVIEVSDDEHIDIITRKELSPTHYAETYAEDTNNRRCANIWANALGWSFSVPIYRDKASEMDTLSLKRPDYKEYIDLPGAHVTKISTRPEKYVNNKIAVVPAEELAEFRQYYNYLKVNNLLADSLEPGYQLCPHCGRPIRIGKEIIDLNEIAKLNYVPRHASKRMCDSCNFSIPEELLIEEKAYYDDSYNDEDEEYVLDRPYFEEEYSEEELD